MNLKLLSLPIFTFLCSCSQKVMVNLVFLNQDSPAGYTAITNNKQTKAYMLLFPGFGETPTDVLDATSLPEEMAKNDIAVFIPTLQNGAETYGFSDESQRCLGDVMDDIQKRYNLAKSVSPDCWKSECPWREMW